MYTSVYIIYVSPDGAEWFTARVEDVNVATRTVSLLSSGVSLVAGGDSRSVERVDLPVNAQWNT